MLLREAACLENLAAGAEVAAAISDRETSNRGAAGRAVLTTTVGNLELKVGGAQCAIGAVVVFYTGSFIINC